MADCAVFLLPSYLTRNLEVMDSGRLASFAFDFRAPLAERDQRISALLSLIMTDLPQRLPKANLPSAIPGIDPDGNQF
jgi:hypothetical protein